MEAPNRRNTLAALAGLSTSIAGIGTAVAQDKPVPPKPQRRARPAPMPPASAKAVVGNATEPAKPISVDTDLGKRLAAAAAEATNEVERLSADLKARKTYLDSIGGRQFEGRFAFTKAIEAAYPSVRCDLLASEAASLIARCLAIRDQWDSLYEASYNYLTDIERFSVLDAIFQIQEQSGYYDIDAALSSGDAQGNEVLQRELDFARGQIENLLNDTFQKYNDVSGWQQLVGFLSHVSGYGNSGDATSQVIWNGATKTVVQYSQDAATALSSNQLDTLISQLSADLTTRRSQVDSLKQRAAGLQTKAIWDQKNKVYRKAQAQAIRSIYKEKLRLANEIDGPLNYVDRLDRMQKIFAQTIFEALVRLPAVSDGLGRLFGLQAPLPPSVVEALASKIGISPNARVVDDTLEWLDGIASQLVIFLQAEQVYSVQVSLRELVSETRWKQFHDNGELMFELPLQLFADQFHVRLRALSVTTRGVQGMLGCTLMLPKTSVYVHKDGTRSPVTQDYIRPLRQSRVMPSGSATTPERFGMNLVYNCSPIGIWLLSTAEHTNIEESRKNISDVFLELVVAGQ